jgi:hypothetical protein
MGDILGDSCESKAEIGGVIAEGDKQHLEPGGRFAIMESGS